MYMQDRNVLQGRWDFLHVDGGIMRFQEVILNNTCISHFDAKCTKLKLESEIISLTYWSFQLNWIIFSCKCKSFWSTHLQNPKTYQNLSQSHSSRTNTDKDIAALEWAAMAAVQLFKVKEKVNIPTKKQC